MSEPIRYAVDLSARAQHLLRVRMLVPADIASGARIVLPTWTPGSYVVRDYVHHVQKISVLGRHGELPLILDGHTSWRLPATESFVQLEFEIYANELTVRTSHVDDHHALIIPPAAFPFVDGATDRPHVVEIDADGQRVWSLLPDGAAPDTFVAEDYLHLVDSAFEVGEHPETDWEVAGVPHRFVWTGHGGRPDLGRIAEEAAAIGEAAVELFDGALPIEHYTFLCAGWDSGGGGLEHRDGAVLMVPTTTFQDPERLKTFQSLLAHEYLHLWNVKRLVPKALVEPDLVKPTHTPSLWVAEGWTAYYDELLPLRAGLWTVKVYLDKIAEQIDNVWHTPGVKLQSLRQSSYEAWTKLYVRDENSVNAGISYYAQGAVVALALDLTIRRERPDSDGLDEALRLLWRRFGETGRGYTEGDVEAAVSEVAGHDLSEFFLRHVEGHELPPLEELVDAVGLEMVDAPTEGRPNPPYLGVQTSEDDQGVVFTSVLRGQPAWRAGLTGGDRLLAIDGQRVARGQLPLILAQYRPGDDVEIAVFRGPRLLTRTARLADRRPKQKLRPVDDPTAEQRTAFHRWTGRTLDEIE